MRGERERQANIMLAVTPGASVPDKGSLYSTARMKALDSVISLSSKKLAHLLGVGSELLLAQTFVAACQNCSRSPRPAWPTAYKTACTHGWTKVGDCHGRSAPREQT